MTTKKKTQRVSTTLRQAVKVSGQSLYDIAHGAGIKYTMLMRFVSEDRPLTQDETDALCEYLGLGLVKQDG